MTTATGRICDKHNEWCPNGECRWCEPVPPDLIAHGDMDPACGYVVPEGLFGIDQNAYATWASGEIAQNNASATMLVAMHRMWAMLAERNR